MFILTEKPSVAKDIANALGRFKYHKGYYTRDDKDCIVHAVGHVLELFEPEDYDESLKKWKIDALPIIPSKMKYKPIKSVKDQLKIIKYCFSKYDSSDFILATDAEREGEFIGALILDYVNFKHYTTAKRFWVSQALTPEVIKDGIKNAKPLSNYEKYKVAGYARQHADWLIGINITRLLTAKTNTLLSFGRVQTAVLSATYVREKSISKFIPEPYNQLEVDCGDFSLWLTGNNGETKLASRDANLIAAQNTLTIGTPITIKNVHTEEKTEHPPKLFNITGLQKYCSEKFKYSPKKTLEIAQKLYEFEKCLSYPRTPSTVLGDDNVDLYQEKYDLLSKEYPVLCKNCKPENISSSNKRIFNSSKLVDHHALIPLKPLSAAAVEEQRNVYTAVLERFFTVIKPPHVYNSIKIDAIAKNFLLSGSLKMIISQGWKNNVEEEENEDEKLASRDANFRIPNTSDIYTVAKTKLHEKFTNAKKHFTEATILTLMENPRGEESSLASLGTPATRAGIIDTLLQRQYIEKKKQNLLISTKGKFLIETVSSFPALCSFVSLSTTTQWETKLHEKPEDFVHQIIEFLQKTIPEIKMTNNSRWEKESTGVCPLCKKGKVLSGQKNWFCTEYKNGCSFVIWKTIRGATITEADVKLLITGSKTRQKTLKNKEGKSFKASLTYNVEGKKVEFVFNKKRKLAVILISIT